MIGIICRQSIKTFHLVRFISENRCLPKTEPQVAGSITSLKKSYAFDTLRGSIRTTLGNVLSCILECNSHQNNWSRSILVSPFMSSCSGVILIWMTES